MSFDEILRRDVAYTPAWVRDEAVRVSRGKLPVDCVLGRHDLPARMPPSSFKINKMFWLSARIYRAFSVLEPLEGGAWARLHELIFGLPADEVGEAAQRCFEWYRRWLSAQNSGELLVPMRIWAKSEQWPRRTYSDELSTQFQSFAQKLAELKSRRPDDRALSLALLLFGWRGFMGRDGSLEPQLRNCIVDTALDELRAFRMGVRAGAALLLTDQLLTHLEAALRVVVSFKSLWSGMKEVLQALRFSSRRCVTPALSFDPSDGADARWSRIPFWLDALLFSYGFTEARTDPQLVRTRTAYAAYCADRIDPFPKTRRSKSHSSGPLEPSKYWRASCVNALAELQEPLDGRAAAVLAAAAISDTDESVRAEAHRALERLGRGRASPIQGLYGANWWMRRAHLLELGGKLDEAAARKVWKRNRQRAKRLGTEFRLPDPDA